MVKAECRAQANLDEAADFEAVRNPLLTRNNSGDPLVTDLTLEQATENVYASIKDDNRDLDQHIAALKSALIREGRKEAVFDPARLAQNNRQGRKLMQSYFRKRGVTVSFAAE